MNGKEIFSEIGSIDEKYIKEADTSMKTEIVKKAWFKTALTAACLALILGVGIPVYYNNSARLPLSAASVNVSVKKVTNAQNNNSTSSMDLVELSEDEIFNTADIVIFEGEIQNIQNIMLNFNGEKEYRAVAEISVEKVHKGELTAGEKVTVLLPCSINNGVLVEDTEVVSAMREGMTGIFMPVKYTDESFYETNNARLCLKDVAIYGFSDGVRFAFLENDDGSLIFSKFAFKTIENAASLAEIEAYIESMIK